MTREINENFLNEKIDKTEDALIQIQSYTKVALGYAEQYLDISEICHLSLILDKIDECIEGLKDYYDTLNRD